MKHIYPMLVSWMLLLTPALTSESPHGAFKSALEEKNITDIQKLLASHNLDINLQNQDGYTMIMLAICRNYMTLATQLLQHDDIDLNLQNKHGATALVLAIFKNHVAMAQLLLKHNTIKINLQNDFGSTPLMVAIFKGHVPIAELLLKHDEIDVNLQNKYGQTALMLAVYWNNIEIVKWLLKRNDIDVNMHNKHRSTALIIAIARGHVTLAQLLLQRNDMDVNLQNKDGQTALMIAICKHDIALTKELLKRDDIDVNLQDNKNKNALAHISNRYIELDRLAIEGGDHCCVSLVKHSQIPSLHKGHALLRSTYLQALYAQQPCSQAMTQYRDLLLINKIANELAEEQKTVFYQACLIAYEAKNSYYSIEAKGIESSKKYSHYQPVLDADLIYLLAGYLREVKMDRVNYESDWAHYIACYLWANNRFATKEHSVNMTLKEVYFWHKQHSPYAEFLNAANRTQKRALFKVVAQQGEYEAVATKHLAQGLKQKNIIQSEKEVCKKSITELTPLIVVGLNAFVYRPCCIH